MRLSPIRPPGPWHEAYRPVDHAPSEAFISNALALAVAEFGQPVIPINQILLRRSRKTEAAGRYRLSEDFSLTECADPANGIFVIYLSVDPGHHNYFALLGHECAHLINPYISDWYMEGIATEFSQRICGKEGVAWGDWEHRFMRSRREPYARSYRMMLELREAFPDEYAALVRRTAPSRRGGEWRRIDIDAWLARLSDSRRESALGIIEPYVKGLRRNVGLQYDFKVPEALK